MAEIFISYAHPDRDDAQKLVNYLEKAGLSVWWDKNLEPGQVFREEIVRAIGEARQVIVLWSETSVTSHFVLDEAGRAAKQKKLVPVRIDSCELPLGFAQYHTHTVSDWSGDLAAVLAAVSPKKPFVKIEDNPSGTTEHNKIVSVDITSLYGIARALTSKKPSQWARDSYNVVATALLQIPSELAIPQPQSDPSSERIIVRPIQMYFGRKAPSNERHKKEANEYSQGIDETTQARIRTALADVWPTQEHNDWIKWHVDNEWRAHIVHCNGLVEPKNIPQLAKILDKSPSELDDINRQAQWKPDEVCAAPTDLQVQMYSADVALRGLYYDKLTELSCGGSIILHPVRRAILDTGKRTVPNTPDPIIPYLLAILGNWACIQHCDDEKKVEAWTQMFMHSAGHYRAFLKENDGAAKWDFKDKAIYKNKAIYIARKAGVENPVRFKYGWEMAFDTLAIGTGIAVSLYAGSPVPESIGLGAAAGLCTDLALRKRLATLSTSDSRIGKLAHKDRWFGGRVFSYEDFNLP